MKQFTRAVVSAALCAALSLACTLPAYAAEGEMLEVNEDISVSADYDWTRFANDHLTLNVYNWGLYISDGSDDSVNVISAFEDLTGIKVNYTTFDSNESLYAKMKSGGASYDVIVPSDYMVGKMIAENMLAELDYDNIPNMANIGENYLGWSYDPDNTYSVPYTWGTTGIIYNSKYVDEADVTGWELLWNEKYAGKILMFDNSRDAFGIAEYLLGYSVNSTDSAELQACADKLAEQKPVVQQYVMDQIFDAMENEEAWIAPYYAGDYLTMVEENPDLRFFRPEDQGYNIFVDGICIPTCAKEKEAAETFINFLIDPEICAKNLDFLGYSVPETEAKQYLDAELVANEVAYPSEEQLRNATSFDFLPEETSREMESLFMTVRNG